MNKREFHEQKTTAEKYLVGINFEADLATGETISSVIAKAYDDMDQDVTSTILEGTSYIGTVSGKDFTENSNGTWVVQTIKGGTPGKFYKISFIINTSSSQNFEGKIELEILE